jgi:hypothetical protein
MADESWVAPGTEGGQGPFGAAPGQPPGQPWAGPYSPQPAPPSRGNVRLRVVLGLLAVAALVAVTVLVALVLPGDAGGDADSAESGSGEPVDVDLVPFRDPEGGYEISVPQGWASASLEGDVSDVGQRTFPDDPALADEFQERVSVLPRVIVFVSLDPREMSRGTFASNLNLVRVSESIGGGVAEGVDELRRTIRAGGGQVVDEGSFSTLAGEATRVEYETRGPVSGIAYLVAAGDEVWVLTYTTTDLDAEEGIADATASTFAPGS